MKAAGTLASVRIRPPDAGSAGLKLAPVRSHPGSSGMGHSGAAAPARNEEAIALPQSLESKCRTGRFPEVRGAALLGFGRNEGQQLLLCYRRRMAFVADDARGVN